MAVPSVDGGRSLETRSGRQPILWLQVDPDAFRDGPLAWLDAQPISPDIRLGGELADQIDAHAVNGLPGPAILDLQARCDAELDRARRGVGELIGAPADKRARRPLEERSRGRAARASRRCCSSLNVTAHSGRGGCLGRQAGSKAPPTR